MSYRFGGNLIDRLLLKGPAAEEKEEAADNGGWDEEEEEEVAGDGVGAEGAEEFGEEEQEEEEQEEEEEPGEEEDEAQEPAAKRRRGGGAAAGAGAGNGAALDGILPLQAKAGGFRPPTPFGQVGKLRGGPPRPSSAPGLAVPQPSRAFRSVPKYGAWPRRPLPPPPPPPTAAAPAPRQPRQPPRPPPRRPPQEAPSPAAGGEAVVDRLPEESLGSANHDLGKCMPCAWFWKPSGCNKGADCLHCHMCAEGEMKARKKAKTIELKRVSAAAKQQRGAAGQEDHAAAQDCGDGCFWARPKKLLFWRDLSGNDAALLGGAGVVEFRAALVLPGATEPPEPGEDGDLEHLLSPEGASHSGLPLAFFFAGLGEKAKDSIVGRYQDWAEVAPEPFILVAADRQPGRWWFIDDETHWGWLSGEFRPEAAELVGSWMQELVGRPGVDHDRVGMFGFSAGAYAATELLAKGCVRLSGLGLGGVHGHGQSDLEGVPAKRASGVIEKFRRFLGRLSEHPGVFWMEATHANSDQQSRWEDASRILGALAARQKELQYPELSVRVLDPEEHDSAPGSKKNKTHHDYFRAAFLRTEFFVALFGGEPPPAPTLPEGLALVEPGEEGEEVGRSAAPLPTPPAGPPPTSLEVEKFSASCEEEGWEELAFDIFREHGFVIVLGLLKLHQYTAVLRDCERAAKSMVTQERRGNRGPGRYSFGVASSTGSMLHVPSFARHLLDSAGKTIRPLLDLIFAEGEDPGFMVLSGGGDFVLGDVRTHQDLHSDIQVSRAQNKHLPPPLLSVNFCVQDLTQHNGPTRIVPGTQLKGGIDGAIEPTEWRCSRLCPVPAGAAIVRDVRVLHGGTPNMTPRPRYLPSIEYVSNDLRATNRKDKFPPIRGLPQELYNKLAPEVQELCGEIVAGAGEKVKVEFSRR